MPIALRGRASFFSLLVSLVAVFLISARPVSAQDAPAPELPPGSCPGERMGTQGTGTFENRQVEGAPVGGVFWTARSRSFWHCHPSGQWLMTWEGVGRVQKRGERSEDVAVGESHYVGPWVEHWHGASYSSDVQWIQIGFQPAGTTWMEEVSEQDYLGNDVGINTRNEFLRTGVRAQPAPVGP